jgi:hypothetical protein
MTLDGFAVAFAVSDDQFRDIVRSHAQSTELQRRLTN